MARYRLDFEYHGGKFCGWQSQKNGLAVQDCIETALAQMVGYGVKTHCAGRTDSGVHALCQTIHCDLDCAFAPWRLRDGVNFYLRAHQISCLAADQLGDDFHARFSALQREYLYRILDNRVSSPLREGALWRLPYRLDVEKMATAAQYLIGEHDFTTFRNAHCQAASPVRHLEQLVVLRQQDEVHIHARARSFLHRQIRSIAGSLVLVGKGKWHPQDVQSALLARQRRRCGPVAPACGLYLCKVTYPSKYDGKDCVGDLVGEQIQDHHADRRQG